MPIAAIPRDTFRVPISRRLFKATRLYLLPRSRLWEVIETLVGSI
jgi:hypothetical protein